LRSGASSCRVTAIETIQLSRMLRRGGALTSR
jgi:hypothetical protein